MKKSTKAKIAHVIKPGLLGPEGIRTRCGLTMAQASNGVLGFEDCLPQLNCLGCLRAMIVELRLARYGLPDNKYTQWLCGGSTGMSSATIWSVMTAVPLHNIERRMGIPHDPSDFGRCHDLLELFPEWKPRLKEVGTVHPEWKPFTDAWDELEALYAEELPLEKAPKLYARLKELEAASQ